MSYAEKTTVPVERTQGEIRSLLARHGADAVIFGDVGGTGFVQFTIRGRNARFVVDFKPLDAFARTPKRRQWRSTDEQYKAREQHCRQRWRSLVLFVRALLEAVEQEITSLDAALLPWMVMPDDRVLSEHLVPQIEQAAQSGIMPRLALPGPKRVEGGT